MAHDEIDAERDQVRAALKLVLELARQNISDDPELAEQAAVQRAACDQVENFTLTFLEE